MAIVPLEVRCPSDVAGSNPNIVASWATHLPFQRGGRRAAVERVVVGVDLLRHRVGGERDLVRRLQHLPGVARMEERVVVPQPLTQLGKHGLCALRRYVQRLVPLEYRPLLLPFLDLVETRTSWRFPCRALVP